MPITYQIVTQASSTVPEGEVISQDPEESGVPVDPNDDIVITLYVSSGPPSSKYARFTMGQPFAVVNFSI